ncbi:MAG: hypothetical protein ACU0BS_10065 [Hasllibacter sp.]
MADVTSWLGWVALGALVVIGGAQLAADDAGGAKFERSWSIRSLL